MGRCTLVPFSLTVYALLNEIMTQVTGSCWQSGWLWGSGAALLGLDKSKKLVAYLYGQETECLPGLLGTLLWMI